ncbi:transcriptional regulator [Escherichia coli]|nr:transcriptional regulator [Escherichia coli]EIY3990363.1 transcriptional regulator [Salmonella enterica]EKL3231919.1 transcriptional regulator [Escherichia coli]EKN4258978.1 transcriptional regulator [Escherichia coli]ELA3981654.1 transcriptional regulator [Escherichia coli]
MRIAPLETVSGERFSKPGSMTQEHFDLLIKIAPINSNKVKLALCDYFVHGYTRKEACEKHNVSQGYFSICIRKVNFINDTVGYLIKYYLPKYLFNERNLFQR